LSPLHSGVTFFSSDVFYFEPIAFCGCLFFHPRPFVLSPLCFGVASFYQMSFILSTLRFGVASFSLVFFCFEPPAFWGCLFFHRVFYFEPANEGRNNAPSFAALTYMA
jgi:hypothetical protein